jgi:prepilin-type N-terminal cleavage/methylation domain-containing protein/prepilin-type processing-associated H-X9-DG protein
VRRIRGFTLIELLVVIAIIAILAAILFPVFAQAREKARAATCLSNIKQVNLGWQMYMQDYDETWIFRPWGLAVGPGPECDWRYVCDSPDTQRGSYINWWDVVKPYTKNHQIIGCPSAPNESWLRDAGWTETTNLGIGINAYPHYGLVDGNRAIESPWGGGVYPGVSLAAVSKPAQTICIGDAGKLWWKEYFDQWGYNWLSTVPTYAGTSPWLSPRMESESGSEWGPDDRHSGMANVGFLDGHVKAMRPEAFYLGKNGLWFRPDRDAVYEDDPPGLQR